MTWVLYKEDSVTKHCLLANTEHSVGRKDCRVVLNNDPSISRKHASISVNFPEANISKPNSIPLVLLKDSSKYGTTVNETKVKPEGVVLKSGDKIKFGVFDNKWRICHEPFVCSSSGLDKADKSIVRQQLAKIGGHMVGEWTSDCNLLITNKLSVSIKLVNALVSQRSVVTSKYLVNLVAAMAQDLADPDPKRFPPDFDDPLLLEAGVDSLLPNAKRMSLLDGRLFVTFSAKQMKKLEYLVKKAGGTITLCDDNIGRCRDLVRQSNSYIIDPASDRSSKTHVFCQDEIKRQGKRFILEAEIGLAIFFCSTEKYCNFENDQDVPELKNVSMIVSQTPNFETQQSVGSQMPSFSTGKHVNSMVISRAKPTVESTCTLSLKQEPSEQEDNNVNEACSRVTPSVSIAPSSIELSVSGFVPETLEEPPHKVAKMEEPTRMEVDSDEDMFVSSPLRTTAPPPRVTAPLPRATAPPPRATAPPPPRATSPSPRTTSPPPQTTSPPSRTTSPPPRARLPQPKMERSGIWNFNRHSKNNNFTEPATPGVTAEPLPPPPSPPPSEGAFRGYLSTRNNPLKSVNGTDDDTDDGNTILISKRKINLSTSWNKAPIRRGGTLNFKTFKKAHPIFATNFTNGGHQRGGRRNDTAEIRRRSALREVEAESQASVLNIGTEPGVADADLCDAENAFDW